MMLVVAVLAAYFLGAIPFGYLMVRWRTGSDIRGKGSGNIGATNVLRTTGIVYGVATLLLDMAKGYVAVWMAGRASDGSAFWMSVAAVSVMAGHAFPIFLGFKGGKAVACFIGAFARLTPLPLVAVLVLFVAVVGWTHYISLGSILAAGTFPLAVWIILHPSPSIVAASIISAILIIYRHRENLHRLNRGTENVLTWGRRS